MVGSLESPHCPQASALGDGKGKNKKHAHKQTNPHSSFAARQPFIITIAHTVCTKDRATSHSVPLTLICVCVWTAHFKNVSLSLSAAARIPLEEGGGEGVRAKFSLLISKGI